MTWTKEQKNDVDYEIKVLDFIYDEIDDRLLQNKFAEVDALLENLKIEKYKTVFLIGFLTITVTAKNELKKRAKFYKKVELHLQKSGKLEKGLLDGLE